MENPLNNITCELAEKAEELGFLPNEWLDTIYQEKWFKLFVPKYLNGLGLSFTTILKTEEELATKDGSLAWTVTLCAGAAWFVGFLNEDLATEVFKDPKVCFAGSGFVGGTANKIADGYIINGSWTYASGALHATHFTANCKILDEGKPFLDKNGESIVKAFLLKRSEVEILDGWCYMGMVATGSHAFKVVEQLVPLNRVFEILPEKAILPDPIFRYPFLQLAEATLVANVLGITLHFLALVDNCFRIRAHTRNYDQAHLTYYSELRCNLLQDILNLRMEFYEVIEKSWQELVNKGNITESTLAEVSKICRELAITCRENAAKLHPYAGLEAAKKHTEINRVWRDMNTVSQHALLIFPF
nr:acyl-CoA dehydrogenase [uncultured Pedobacter sp.]